MAGLPESSDVPGLLPDDDPDYPDPPSSSPDVDETTSSDVSNYRHHLMTVFVKNKTSGAEINESAVLAQKAAAQVEGLAAVALMVKSSRRV